MSLQVTLVENTLNNGLALRPRVVNRIAVEFEEILRLMSMDTALEEVDMRLAVERLKMALVFYLAKGNSVETPLGIFAAHVRGARNGDPVTPEITRDGMVIRFRPNRTMHRDIQTSLALSMEDQMDPKRPRITALMNVENVEAENQVSPGELVHLVGSRLSFEIEAADEGLFFVNESGQEFRTTVYSRHGTKIVDCKVPELPAGTYTLELRARPRKGAELRTGEYANTVTVS
ncbi:MAG: DUF4469 domain-containing protein [Alkalispirochaeta sp.]